MSTALQALPLNPDAMWRAFHDRDARYDGRFVTGVRTTGICCRPSCSCRKPRRENVEYFRSVELAARAGYRPCKRCRPELAGGRAEAERSLARAALEHFRAHDDGRCSLACVSRALAVSPAHFARRFRAADGRTPMQALSAIRVERARPALAAGNRVLDVALSVGFQSPSAFARAFRAAEGVSPSRWRERARREREKNSHG